MSVMIPLEMILGLCVINFAALGYVIGGMIVCSLFVKVRHPDPSVMVKARRYIIDAFCGAFGFFGSIIVLVVAKEYIVKEAVYVLIGVAVISLIVFFYNKWQALSVRAIPGWRSCKGE